MGPYTRASEQSAFIIEGQLDIDAFKAEVKINQIYEAVRDSVPWDVTCVRSKHAISIHCMSFFS